MKKMSYTGNPYTEVKIQFNNKMFQVILKPESNSDITHADIDHQRKYNEEIFNWNYFTNIAYYNNYWLIHRLKTKKI